MGTTIKLQQSDVKDLTKNVVLSAAKVSTTADDVPSVKKSSGIMITQYRQAATDLANTMRDFVELLIKDMLDINKATDTIVAVDTQLGTTIKS